MSAFEDRGDSEADGEIYTGYLTEARARSDELTSLQQSTGCVSLGCRRDGLPVLLLVPHLGLPRVYLQGETELDMLKKVLLLFIKEADEAVKSDYVLVYGYYPLTFMSQRELVMNTYSMLPKRYKKNIKDLYLLHPKMGVKVFLEFTKLFVSSKFSRKIHQEKNISEFQKKINHKELALPPQFLESEEKDVVGKGGI
jgi:hypothetical protein